MKACHTLIVSAEKKEGRVAETQRLGRAGTEKGGICVLMLQMWLVKEVRLAKNYCASL